MHRKPVFPAFAASLAALLAGCEWTGTSSSDSWSGSYDAMNFSGTYRSTSTLTSSSESSEDETISTRETVGSYHAGTYRYSGNLSHAPVVLDSVQIQLGGITFTGDGSGNLVSDYGSGKVTSAGAWSVDVTGNSTTTTEASTTGGIAQKVSNESMGSVSQQGHFTATLKSHPIVPGSVVVSFDNGMSFSDDGANKLVSSTSGAGGNIEYTGGGITLDWTGASSAMQQYQGAVHASYSFYANVTTPGSSSTTASPLQGSGSIVAIYSYSSGGRTSGASIATTSSDVTAITVSQSGQNLVMTTNTGVQMTGKFTAVRQTGSAASSSTSSSDSSGVDTYNAQFQVSSSAGHKFVGTLNHDLVTQHCTLNGTLTHGSASYDVQGVGPAFSASASSTAN